jgi:hypothetical protein
MLVVPLRMPASVELSRRTRPNAGSTVTGLYIPKTRSHNTPIVSFTQWGECRVESAPTAGKHRLLVTLAVTHRISEIGWAAGQRPND